MTTRKRRDPKLAGVAGLTAADIAALSAGRQTLQGLADKLGVSKQAISRKARTMRAPVLTGSSIPIGATPAPTSTGPTIPSGPVLIDPHQAAVSANLAVIHRAASLLEGPDMLGASAIKMLAGAVALARSELAALGVLAPDDDEDTPTEFVIRVLTDQEHAEIKRRVELPDDYED